MRLGIIEVQVTLKFCLVASETSDIDVVQYQIVKQRGSARRYYRLGVCRAGTLG